MYVCIYVCMYACMYACIYVCTSVCMYVRLYVCMFRMEVSMCACIRLMYRCYCTYRLQVYVYRRLNHFLSPKHFFHIPFFFFIFSFFIFNFLFPFIIDILIQAMKIVFLVWGYLQLVMLSVRAAGIRYLKYGHKYRHK